VALKWIKNAFALDNPAGASFTPREEALLDKLARKIHRHGLEIPAVVFLESVQPLNFVASQVMVFFQPLVGAFFTSGEYELFASLLERRGTIEKLLQKIENYHQSQSPSRKNNSDGA